MATYNVSPTKLMLKSKVEQIIAPEFLALHAKSQVNSNVTFNQ